MPILEFLDYAGVAIFAATGALFGLPQAARHHRLSVSASATGIGGGNHPRPRSRRDAGVLVVNPNFIIVCAAVAVAVFLTSHLLESRYRMLVWLDALGLSPIA